MVHPSTSGRGDVVAVGIGSRIRPRHSLFATGGSPDETPQVVAGCSFQDRLANAREIMGVLARRRCPDVSPPETTANTGCGFWLAWDAGV